MSSWAKMALFVLITALLTRLLPFSEFFRNVYTLVHEMAHAVVTLLLSGSVLYIHLYADQSGVTHSMIEAGWRTIPVALAGYTGAALFAWLLFRLQADKRERTGLMIVAAVAALALLLFVRNPYGMLWCAGFAGATLLIGVLAPGWLRIFYASLVSFICLVESVLSSFMILALSIVEPASAGDAANLSRATPLPAAAWGAFFALFSLWCAKNAVTVLFRSIRRRRSEQIRQAERMTYPFRNR
ncbi:MAG: hypothetical protein A9Z00_10070 [Thermobacillus sp. ZCTH02-B1]|uniref:M50 family metallopeptidase n=1 Tax=Thermobacillus sp. ZCTH02-B1 TaxID=1858795 RepID=UPI000B562AB0|nr:M50 family metallopeptidase [Thermobacillus sp. ZCTH02-B1]OUM97401.1 MAG: hypothetical protein A9Z00_10070 [Thermobacillus sp. ZCTH02-B1]